MADELYYWRTPDGKLIVNDKKQPIKCASCPCNYEPMSRAYYIYSHGNNSSVGCCAIPKDGDGLSRMWVSYLVHYTSYSAGDAPPKPAASYEKSLWLGEPFPTSEIECTERKLQITLDQLSCTTTSKDAGVLVIKKTEYTGECKETSNTTNLYDYNIELLQSACSGTIDKKADYKVVKIKDGALSIKYTEYAPSEKLCELQYCHFKGSSEDPTSCLAFHGMINKVSTFVDLGNHEYIKIRSTSECKEPQAVRWDLYYNGYIQATVTTTISEAGEFVGCPWTKADLERYEDYLNTCEIGAEQITACVGKEKIAVIKVGGVLSFKGELKTENFEETDSWKTEPITVTLSATAPNIDDRRLQTWCKASDGKIETNVIEKNCT